MKLPNASRAIIDPAKLRDYLLSPAHPVGRFKAPFFVALGYTQEQWQRLESDFRAQHLAQEAQPAATSPSGKSTRSALCRLLQAVVRPRSSACGSSLRAKTPRGSLPHIQEVLREVSPP